tara:strand:+ start:6819 stop:7154 length:336 start_codon:yes stop_codon:yes gene_type:complete
MMNKNFPKVSATALAAVFVAHSALADDKDPNHEHVEQVCAEKMQSDNRIRSRAKRAFKVQSPRYYSEEHGGVDLGIKVEAPDGSGKLYQCIYQGEEKREPIIKVIDAAPGK